MHGGNAHAALCDHVARDGAVDSAGDEQHRVAVAADRHAARAEALLRENERLVLADFHAHVKVRRVHVHA